MIVPTISIIGRPNVGKSSLLNKIIGKRASIVDNRPGVTRDRLYAISDWNGQSLSFIDTGGIFFDESLKDSDQFQDEIELQVQISIEESDLILFMVNVEDGITPFDRYIAAELMKSSRKVFVTVNKVENSNRQVDATEFYELGFDDVYNISALHGNGIGDLLDAVCEAVPSVDVDKIDDDSVPIAIVGKPNVGKSSLFNKFIGQKRSIVSDVAGTTRDSVDAIFTYYSKKFKIVDTAGIRRKSKIIDCIENYSVLRALQSIKFAKVVLMVLDASQPISEQDKRIAGIIEEEGKGCVIVVNKWDLIEKDANTLLEYSEIIKDEFRFLGNAPIMFVSALTGKRVSAIIEKIIEVNEVADKRISTPELNELISAVVAHKPPPSYKGKRLKISYVTQPKINPPLFLFFVNNPDLVHFSYKRFLENRIREAYGFDGVPIRMSFRAKNKK